jgi:hypothetical protein
MAGVAAATDIAAATDMGVVDMPVEYAVALR